MKKSIYSLVLFDEIVDEIDAMACELSTNRSQLINEILADYIGLTTPDQKIKIIIENLKETFKSDFSIEQLKPSSIHFKRVLQVKYHPKIDYSYEFIGEKDNRFAVFKISSRTRSRDLRALFNEFYEKIGQLEEKNHFFPVNKNKDNNFVREFQYQGLISRDTNDISRFLTSYLRMIDSALNLFLGETDNLDEGLQALYNKFLLTKELQVSSHKPLVIREISLPSLCE